MWVLILAFWLVSLSWPLDSKCRVEASLKTLNHGLRVLSVASEVILGVNELNGLLSYFLILRNWWTLGVKDRVFCNQTEISKARCFFIFFPRISIIVFYRCFFSVSACFVGLQYISLKLFVLGLVNEMRISLILIFLGF